MKKYIVYDTTGNPVGVPFNTLKDAETYKIVYGRLDWTVKLTHIHIDRKPTEKQRRAVLLWVTTFAVILFISGVDSITDQGYFVPWLGVWSVLCYLFYRYISEDELYTLSGAKWLEKKLGSSDDF